MMTGKEKLYFLLNRIVDAKALAPADSPVLIHPANDLNKKYTKLELMQLFSKLQDNEKVIRILKLPNDPSILAEPHNDLDQGCYGLEILNEFDVYFSKLQQEPEYQKFSGKVPARREPDEDTLKRQEAEQALRPANFTPRSVLPVSVTADEVMKNFSPGNYPFLLSVIEVILSLTDFSPDGKIAYKLQYPPGQSLINERMLLDRLSQMGLLSHYGEDGIFGIVTLGNINIKVLREVESKLSAAGNKTTSQLAGANSSLGIDEESNIEKWIKNKDDWTRKKIWQVVSVIYSEWQLRDEDTFRIPIDKFIKDWIDNEGELEAILTNLHNRKIIEVSRKLGETPPTNDPNKPKGSVWATIADQPEIIRKEDTQIKLFTKKFGYLVSKLQDLVTEDGKDETSSLVVKQTSPGIEWQEDFQWEGNDFIFGKYGKAIFVSPDRIKLFKLLTDAKGNWVTVQKMEKVTGKNEGTYIRPTIGQIERQLDSKLRRHVTIPSTQEDDAGQKPNQGAYRIKFIGKP